MSENGNQREELISIDYNGKVYTGRLIITGTYKLRFQVEYNGHVEGDSRTWGTSSEELQNLHVMAELLLSRIVADVERL